MTTRMYGRTLGALASSLLIVAACTSSGASLTAPGSPGDSVAAESESPAATEPAATDPGASDSAVPSASSSASAIATPTAAARVAWVRGQTVKQYDLVAPGKGWVYTNQNVWQTVDDGATWAKATPPRLIVSKIRGLGALDANRALLAVVDVTPGTSIYYIWRTTNAGQTWAYTALPGIPNEVPATPCVPGDFCGGSGDPLVAFDNVDANTAFVTIHMRTGFDGMNPYIFGTTDGGATWARRTYEPPDDSPTGSCCMYQVNFMTRDIGVAQFHDQISSTITGWGHWTHRHLPSTDFSAPAIDFLSATKWYGDLGLEYGTVRYTYTISTDQGRHWNNYTSNVPGIPNLVDAHVQFLGPLVWIGTEHTYAGVGTNTSQTIYTTDAGRHWALMGRQPIAGSAFFIDATHGWTGAQGDPLYTTSNGGLSWRLLTP